MENASMFCLKRLFVCFKTSVCLKEDVCSFSGVPEFLSYFVVGRQLYSQFFSQFNHIKQ